MFKVQWALPLAQPSLCIHTFHNNVMKQRMLGEDIILLIQNPGSQQS